MMQRSTGTEMYVVKVQGFWYEREDILMCLAGLQMYLCS